MTFNQSARAYYLVYFIKLFRNTVAFPLKEMATFFCVSMEYIQTFVNVRESDKTVVESQFEGEFQSTVCAYFTYFDKRCPLP